MRTGFGISRYVFLAICATAARTTLYRFSNCLVTSAEFPIPLNDLAYRQYASSWCFLGDGFPLCADGARDSLQLKLKLKAKG